MRSTRGIFVGGISSGFLTWIASLVSNSDGDPLLAALIGFILGALVGAVIGILVFVRVFERIAPYAFVGAIAGALIFTLAANYDVGLDDIVDNTWMGLISGFVIGGLIGLATARSLILVQEKQAD